MKPLETKEKLQKAMEQEKAPSKKDWSNPTPKRKNLYRKAAAYHRESKKRERFP